MVGHAGVALLPELAVMLADGGDCLSDLADLALAQLPAAGHTPPVLVGSDSAGVCELTGLADPATGRPAPACCAAAP